MRISGLLKIISKTYAELNLKTALVFNIKKTHMKHLYLLFSILLAGTLFLANSGGRASDARAGNTGAPGDQSNGGNPVTCQFCHNSATIQILTNIQLLDTTGMDVTTYIPGQTYRLRTTVSPTRGNPTGYGFQLIPILDRNNTDAKGLQNPASNVKIVTVPSSGRTYAEHNGISNSQVFEVDWIAPAAGSGAVSFYAAANGVNRNGGSSGDGAASARLTIEESLGTAAREEATKYSFRVFPNPAADLLFVESSNTDNLTCMLLQSNGKPAARFTQGLSSGMDVSRLLPGTYTLMLVNADGLTVYASPLIIQR
jgi:hypothetical protein